MRILLSFILIVNLLNSCKNKVDSQYTQISGFAQGTTYHITYQNSSSTDYTYSIDSILIDFDQSLSIYNDSSIISRINENDTSVIVNEHFIKVFEKSLEVWQQSGGLFDITVAPLVNAWGFGPKGKTKMNQHRIDSLLEIVGMQKITLANNHIVKDDPRVKLDVNAIAQGYSVDLVCEFFDKLSITNYLVEIGGEVRGKGVNAKNKPWRIGVDKPQDGNNIPGQELQAIINIDNKALATSGDYRKFIEEDGKKYAHHINPKTGYSAKSRLLSASILANDCITADAYGTACMVAGIDKAKELIDKNPELEAFFIYSDEKGNYLEYATEGMKKIIDKVTQ